MDDGAHTRLIMLKLPNPVVPMNHDPFGVNGEEPPLRVAQSYLTHGHNFIITLKLSVCLILGAVYVPVQEYSDTCRFALICRLYWLIVSSGVRGDGMIYRKGH